MEYSKLLDLTIDLGYQLAMSGAETFRVEESINRILHAYGIDSEAFAIPNCLYVSINPSEGQPLTRMRRIGKHGNDLDSVERFTNLSRRICAETPAPEVARQWLNEAVQGRRSYPAFWYLLGHFLGAFGFCFLFGGTPLDSLFSGVFGIVIGMVNHFAQRFNANHFFSIIIASFLMALPAYCLSAFGIASNPDTIIIGALMLLVPGLLFTNALRDIIHGDTNSGINRIVQVILIALAIAVGTAGAWGLADGIWGITQAIAVTYYAPWFQAIACFLACMGFAIIFNIHGPGTMICSAGGVLTWLIFLLSRHISGNDFIAYFISTVFATIYSEIMARVRKYPAISYLVISIFPLIPGAGVYFTMNYALRGEMDAFAQQGLITGGIAGIIAAAILLGSTAIRLITLARSKQ